MRQSRGKIGLVGMLGVLLRIGLGVMFIYSGWMKILQPQQFLTNVYAYDLVGPQMALGVAMVLPWLEVLVGIGLIGRIFPLGAALWSVALAIVFLFVQSSAVARGLSISCGCFGTESTQMIGKFTLARTGVIFLVTLIVLAQTLREGRAPRAARQTAASQPEPTGAATEPAA